MKTLLVLCYALAAFTAAVAGLTLAAYVEGKPAPAAPVKAVVPLYMEA